MSERKVIRINAEAMKQVKELAKLYDLTDSEAAEKAIGTGSSRLASLRRYGTKGTNGASKKPRTKKSTKKARKAKAKAKPKKAARKAASKKAAKPKSLADRARAARGA
jgi:hypothetical protein